MRNSLLVFAVVGASLVVAGCGDASPNTSQYYHTDGTVHDPSTDGTDQGQAPPPADANTPPAAPSTPGTPSAAGFAVTVDNATPTGDLGTAAAPVTVTVTPQNNFQGSINLSVTGLPAGVTAAFDNATVSITGAAVTAKLTLTVDYGAAPVTTPIVVSAASGSAAPATANVNFKANPQLTVHIPLNIDAMNAGGAKFVNGYGAAFGTAPTKIQVPAASSVIVLVSNDDSQPQEVHGNGANVTGPGNVTSTGSFPHGAADIPAMSMEMANGVPRQRTITPGNIYTGYMHDGGQTGTYFQLVTQ